MRTEVGGSRITRDMALSKLFHHFGVLDTFSRLQKLAVLLKKISRHKESGALVSVHKSMIA